MTKKELLTIIKDVPDNAQVYVWLRDVRYGDHLCNLSVVLEEINKKPVVSLNAHADMDTMMAFTKYLND